MKKIISGCLCVVASALYAQQPPGTEIYLFDLSVKKKEVIASNPQNITNKPGYDNQPFFHPDEQLLYYTSANADGRTDLVEYNLKTKSSRAFTNTPEREYSPTVTPDGLFISCIIQRDDGKQDLGKYPIGGGEPIILINTLTVGYHAWANNYALLLFVLGDTLTLHRYDIVSNADGTIAKNIGRSLHKIPKTTSMSFVHKLSDDQWMIKRLNEDGGIEPIVETLPAREDLTWTPDGKILMSDGKKLFFYEPGLSTNWQEATLPATIPAGTITRLAVNPKGNKLALVISE